jgi:hypothetical protein
MQNDKHYREQLVKLALLFDYDTEKIKQKAGIMYATLQDMTQKQFDTACNALAQSFRPTYSNPFPSPADFRLAVGQDAETRARNIVSTVRKAIRAHGRYSSVDFGDRSLHVVIERYGGWPELCAWTEEDWKFKETGFVKAYESAARAGEQGSKYMPGLQELENANKGCTEFISEPQKVSNKFLSLKRKNNAALTD